MTFCSIIVKDCQPSARVAERAAPFEFKIFDRPKAFVIISWAQVAILDMISASVYRESCTPLIIGENRANFTNTIEPTKNCQKVKFNAMFRHCNSFELFNLENRWRFDIYITRIKFLRKSRSGVKIQKQAGPKVSNEAEAYFEESTGYATCMCVTICMPI